MGILIDTKTRAIVQGITGKEGSFHTKLMLEYGTKIVAGTSPGKGGSYVHGVPVYNTIAEAIREQGRIDASIVFVPAKFAPDAVYEAIANNIKIVVTITEGIPVHDELRFISYARKKGVTIIGPNTPGIMTVNQCKLGIMPSQVFKQGTVGIVSRSGTLTYEVAREIAKHGYGVSTVIGLGGDPVTGLDFIDVVKMFIEDKDTDSIILIGEIGGDAEERFATFYKHLENRKPIVAYIAGRTAPPGKRMGHAGAIISMGMGDYFSKKTSLENAGIPVADTPSKVPSLLSMLTRR